MNGKEGLTIGVIGTLSEAFYELLTDTRDNATQPRTLAYAFSGKRN